MNLCSPPPARVAARVRCPRVRSAAAAPRAAAAGPQGCPGLAAAPERAFWDWFEGRGGQASGGLYLDRFGDVRGLASSEPLEEGALVASVPPAAQFGSLAAENSEIAALWAGVPEGEGIRSASCTHLRIAALLLLEATRAAGGGGGEEEGTLGPFLCILPRADLGEDGVRTTDVSWTAEERDMLGDPTLAAAMESHAALCDQLYDTLVAPGLAEITGGVPPTRATWRWAVSMVTSRIFGGGEEGRLVPLLELVNHRPAYAGANAVAKPVHGDEADALGVEEGSYVLLASEAVPAGDELFHCYRKDNPLGIAPAGELLKDYGYLPSPLTASLECQVYESGEEAQAALDVVFPPQAAPGVALIAALEDTAADLAVLGAGGLGPREDLAVTYRVGRRLLAVATFLLFLAATVEGGEPRVQGLLGQCAERAEAPEAANLVVRMIAICKEREQRNEEVVWGI